MSPHNLENRTQSRNLSNLSLSLVLSLTLYNDHFPLPSPSHCSLMMRTIMPAASHEASSSQRRNFKWIIRSGRCKDDQEKDNQSSSTSTFHSPPETASVARRRSSAAAVAVSRFRSVVTAALLASRRNRSDKSGSRMTGTLYGHRRGHVQLAFQVESSKSSPTLLLELTTPTSNLVREMGSGLVRIALECERRELKEPKKLLEETIWRAYCNGRKCGYAVRRDCGPADWKVLKAVEPVSMGAGVLPDGEVMYMRARFERVVGSRDSEAFYMMNPDGSGGGTELSIYFLRL